MSGNADIALLSGERSLRNMADGMTQSFGIDSLLDNR